MQWYITSGCPDVAHCLQVSDRTVSHVQRGEVTEPGPEQYRQQPKLNVTPKTHTTNTRLTHTHKLTHLLAELMLAGWKCCRGSGGPCRLTPAVL